jgi:hypothetical protein
MLEMPASSLIAQCFDAEPFHRPSSLVRYEGTAVGRSRVRSIDPCNDALAPMNIEMESTSVLRVAGTRLTERQSNNHEPRQTLTPTAMSIFDVHVRIANENNAATCI